MKNKQETLQRKPKGNQRIILQPTHSHGPVVSVDVDQYLKDQSESDFDHESLDSDENNAKAYFTTETNNTHDLSRDNYTLEQKFISRDEIAAMLEAGNLYQLENLWTERMKAIQFREDACALLAKLRYLKGIDSEEVEYSSLTNHESVQDFEFMQELGSGASIHIPNEEKLSSVSGMPYAKADETLEGEKRVTDAIKTVRDGQTRFRNALINFYGAKCMVTGEQVESVIEAAHISPYDGNKSNHLSNGLLLRVDIHRLFDKNLLAIEPNTLTIHLHPSLNGSSYSDLQGKKLLIKSDDLIDRKILRFRFKESVG